MRKRSVALVLVPLLGLIACSSDEKADGPCATASAFFTQVDELQAQATDGQVTPDAVSATAERWVAFRSAAAGGVPTDDVDEAVTAVTASPDPSATEVDGLVASADALRGEIEASFPGCEL